MLTFYQYLAFLIPPIFVLAKGYFLSIEFSLYPYLVSEGLLPYKNIIDQHFPSGFFGTFSLPYLAVNTPFKLLLLLIGLNFFSTYLLYLTFKKTNTAMYQLWLLVFSLLLVFFSVNTLWVETFVSCLLALVFYLNTKAKGYYSFTSGLIVSQIILLRPTIFLFLCGYFILFERHKVLSFMGGVVGLLLSFWYLIENNILFDFYRVVILFNKDVYSHVQSQSPTTRQLLSLVLLALTFTVISVWKKKPQYSLLFLSTALLAYPRFGLEHLQVFGLVFVYFLAHLKLSKKVVRFVIAVSFLVAVPPLLSVFKSTYGNYFYDPSVLSLSAEIKNLPDKNIYLYGASDLIYQLTEKLPPDNYYLPSLPWYLNYPEFQEKLKVALSSTNTVVVDPNFSVDGQKLIETTPELFSYIKMNYYLDKKINHLEIYKIKK